MSSDQAPLGERLTRVEVMLATVLQNQDKQSELIRDLTAGQDQRRAYEKIGKHVFEITKILVAAITGAAAAGWLGRGHT